jgi:hypothetical protein
VVVSALKEGVAASVAEFLRVRFHQPTKLCIVLGIQQGSPVIDSLIESGGCGEDVRGFEVFHILFDLGQNPGSVVGPGVKNRNFKTIASSL